MLRTLLGIILVLAFFDASAFEAPADTSISAMEQSSEIPHEQAPNGTGDSEEDTTEKEKDCFDLYVFGYHHSFNAYNVPFQLYESAHYKPPFLASSLRPPKA